MEKINLSRREIHPLYHDKSRDIETALAWNAIKKGLQKLGKGELFEYIKSIKVTEKYVTVLTNKPIINAELAHIQDELQQCIIESHLPSRVLRVKLAGV